MATDAGNNRPGPYLLSDFGQVVAGVNVAAFVVTAAALVIASWRARPWPTPLRPSVAASH